MWFCCYSFGSQLAWKNFDCSSLSQWQIPSRLLDRASSFSSFSHSLILPKMLFNTLSLPFSCYDYYSLRWLVLGESQTLHQVAQVPLLENSRRFPSTSHWTLFCAVLSSHQAHISSASYQIQSIPFKVGDVDAAPLPPIPVLEARTSAHVINCSAFGFQLCFPCFPDCYCRFPFPLFDNWFLLCEVPVSYRATIEEF